MSKVTPFKILPNGLVTAVVLTATVVTSACASEPNPTTPTSPPPSVSPATSSAFPFPRIQSHSDLAVPLDMQRQEAAEFALTEVDLVDDWLRTRERVIPPEILARVGLGNKPAWIAASPLPETGGVLNRVVSVREVSPSRWDVDICRYDTPGVYSMGADGQLKLTSPGEHYSAVTSIVALTTEPNGAGERSDTPRLLIIDAEPITNDMAQETCAPFRPDPYIQQPPQPISPGK